MGKDKMWNGIGRYGFIGPTTATTDMWYKSTDRMIQGFS